MFSDTDNKKTAEQTQYALNPIADAAVKVVNESEDFTVLGSKRETARDISINLDSELNFEKPQEETEVSGKRWLRSISKKNKGQAKLKLEEQLGKKGENYEIIELTEESSGKKEVVCEVIDA